MESSLGAAKETEREEVPIPGQRAPNLNVRKEHCVLTCVQLLLPISLMGIVSPTAEAGLCGLWRTSKNL